MTQSKDSTCPSVRLVAIPQVDLSLLPLSLPPADGINSGGYKVPILYGDWRQGVHLQSGHQYSPIDLLVCGLEAQRRNLIVTSLVSFFDNNRSGVLSEHKVYLVFTYLGEFLCESVSWLKTIVIQNKDTVALNYLIVNAPLTFKWVTI